MLNQKFNSVKPPISCSVMKTSILRTVREVRANTLAKKQRNNVKLTILACSDKRWSSLLICSMNVSSLINKNLCDFQVTIVACFTQRSVIVEVLLIKSSTSFNKKFYDAKVAFFSCVVKWSVFVRANIIHVLIEWKITLVIFVRWIE